MCGELFSYDCFIPPLQMLISTGHRKVHSHAMNAYRRPRQYIYHHWVLGRVTPGCAFILSVCILMLPVLELAAEHMEIATGRLNRIINQRHAYPHLKTLSCTPLVIPSLDNVLPVMVLQNRVVKMNMRHPSSHSSVLRFFPLTSPVVPRLSAAVGRRAVGVVVVLLLLMCGDIETNPGPLGELLVLPYSDINMSLPDNINSTQDKGNYHNYILV